MFHTYLFCRFHMWLPYGFIQSKFAKDKINSDNFKNSDRLSSKDFLTHYSPVLLFYTPWKQATLGFNGLDLCFLIRDRLETCFSDDSRGNGG